MDLSYQSHTTHANECSAVPPPGTRNQERQRIAEEASHWQAIERLRREPTEENARSGTRVFLWLAKRHRPDQGGTNQGFLRVKDDCDLALAAWRH